MERMGKSQTVHFTLHENYSGHTIIYNYSFLCINGIDLLADVTDNDKAESVVEVSQASCISIMYTHRILISVLLLHIVILVSKNRGVKRYHCSHTHLKLIIS
jgi:hypothetical protein